MRRFVVSLTWLLALVAAAEEETLDVPSDPTAKYFILEYRGGAGWTGLLIRKVVGTEVSYFQRDFDCQQHTVNYYGSGDSLQAVRNSKSGPFRMRIAEGSVDHDLWIEACALQTPEQKRLAERMADGKKRMDLERRIQQLRPRRTNGPLRAINVDDEEVREIQSVVADIVPGAIVNIGGVVAGCPCEDGSSCSAQVWIVAYNSNKSKGLLLSRIKNGWHVGPVQQWWLDYEAVHSQGRRLSMEEEDALMDRFPTCATQLAVPGGTAAERPRP